MQCLLSLLVVSHQTTRGRKVLKINPFLNQLGGADAGVYPTLKTKIQDHLCTTATPWELMWLTLCVIKTSHQFDCITIASPPDFFFCIFFIQVVKIPHRCSHILFYSVFR